MAAVHTLGPPRAWLRSKIFVTPQYHRLHHKHPNKISAAYLSSGTGCAAPRVCVATGNFFSTSKLKRWLKIFKDMTRRTRISMQDTSVPLTPLDKCWAVDGRVYVEFLRDAADACGWAFRRSVDRGKCELDILATAADRIPVEVPRRQPIMHPKVFNHIRVKKTLVCLIKMPIPALIITVGETLERAKHHFGKDPPTRGKLQLRRYHSRTRRGMDGEAVFAEMYSNASIRAHFKWQS